MAMYSLQLTAVLPDWPTWRDLGSQPESAIGREHPSVAPTSVARSRNCPMLSSSPTPRPTDRMKSTAATSTSPVASGAMSGPKRARAAGQLGTRLRTGAAAGLKFGLKVPVRTVRLPGKSSSTLTFWPYPPRVATSSPPSKSSLNTSVAKPVPCRVANAAAMLIESTVWPSRISAGSTSDMAAASAASLTSASNSCAGEAIVKIWSTPSTLTAGTKRSAFEPTIATVTRSPRALRTSWAAAISSWVTGRSSPSRCSARIRIPPMLMPPCIRG